MAQRPKTRAKGTAKPAGKTKPATRQAAARQAANKQTTRKPAKALGTVAAEEAKRKPAASSRGAKAPTKPAKAAAKPAAAKAGAPAKSAKTAPPLRTAAKTGKAAARQGAAKTPATPKTGAAAKAPPKVAARPTTRRKSARAKAAATPQKIPYLAAELGQPVDYEGEPIGAGSAAVRSDKDLQDYTLQLWRQMQSGGVVNRYMRAIERAGLTIDEVWTAGVTETRSTSSTADEMRRYREKLLFRANLLEAILSETVADLHRLDGIEPGDATDAAPADANATGSAAPAASA